MKFTELFSLISESTSMKSDMYANKLKNAYRAIFDLYSNDIQISFKELNPPSYMNNYISVNVEISYNGKKYKIYHKVYHLKIPEKSLRSANNAEHYHDTISNLEKTPRQPLTDDLIDHPHIQVKTVVAVYRLEDSVDKYKLPERTDLGRYEVYRGLGDIIKGVKILIDRSSESEGGGEEEVPEPTPTVPNKTLVPA